MSKDRRYELAITPDAKIIVERSSATPIEYAIVLAARRDGRWHRVRVFDNAHGPAEHHEHRISGTTAHEPIITYGHSNAAMAAALAKIKASWHTWINEWDDTR